MSTTRRTRTRLGAAGLATAEIAVLPEAGHAAHLENQPAAIDAITDFLDRVDGL